MANQILIKRGTAANFGTVTLAEGELALLTDTGQVYIGTSSGEVLIRGMSDPVQQGDTDASQWGFVDTDPNLAADSDEVLPTVRAVKTYTDSAVAANDAMTFIGALNCDANPNYPAADKGDTYKVNLPGKIGGASGVNVYFGDLLVCKTDNTPSGDHAAVGTEWAILESNSDGAVIGPSNAINSHLVAFDGTTGKLIKDSGKTIADFAAASHNHDASELTTGTLPNSRVSVSNVTQHASAINLGNLGNTNIASPVDGQLLMYDDGTSKWINGNLSGQTGIAISGTNISIDDNVVVTHDDIINGGTF